MTNELYFLWLDDEDSRERNAKLLEKFKFVGPGKSFSVVTKFIPLRKKDPAGEIKCIKNIEDFDLVLIDHVLNNVSSSIGLNKGTMLAQIIQSKNEYCPIVGITGADKKRDIDLQSLNIYEKLFTIDEIDKYYNFFIVLARDYKKLFQVNSRKGLVKLFDPPNEEKDRLSYALPVQDFRKKTFVRKLAHWVINDFIERPGMIIDEAWTANTVGLNTVGFKKVKKYFDEAKYEGIFSDENRPRWWAIKVKKIVLELTKQKMALPNQAGQHLPKINKKDISVCNYCHELFPDTLGYTDTSESKKLVPLHIRCSESQPGESSLYFENIRVMNDKKNKK